MCQRSLRCLALCATLIGLVPLDSGPQAQEATHFLTILDDRFEPSTLNVKAGVKVKLRVKNARKVAAEFESAQLNREKVAPPGQTVTVYIGPLVPGTYPFFDDFHQSTRGILVAK
jgi:plastocyanin